MATSQLSIKITAVDQASAALKSIQSGIIRLVGAVVALTAAFKAIAFPVKAAADFEREMINVAKTTNFTDAQIEKLSGSMIELSKSMSLSATELASIAAVAGQLGLGSFGVEAIEKFTESVAKASVTLGLTADKAAEFGAQISSIFTIDPGNIERVFATLNELSNTSVASAGQLADIIKRIGNIAGVTLQQTAGLAAFARDLGVQVEVAGTAFVKFLSNMTSKADDFAKVANISTKEWLELIEKDAVVALTTVTSKLYEMDRAQRDATAKELFGGGRLLSVATKLINDAANGYERLYTHIDNANSAYDAGTSSLLEYDKVMTSLSEQTKVMFNSMRALAVEMGENLTPVVLDAVKSIQEFLSSDEGRDFFFQLSEGIGEFINLIIDSVTYLSNFGNQWANILRVLKNVIVVLVSVKVASVAFTILATSTLGLYSAFVKLSKGLIILKALLGSFGFVGTVVAVFNTLKLSLVAATVSVTGFTGALAVLLSPIGLMVAAVAALAAGLYFFEEEIRNLLGIQTTVDLDIEVQERVDKRKISEEVRKAKTTLADLAQKVANESQIDIVFPMQVSAQINKVEFNRKILKDFVDAVDVAEASEKLSANLETQLNEQLNNVDIDTAIRLKAAIGDNPAIELQDYAKELDNIDGQIQAIQDKGSWFSAEDHARNIADMAELRLKIVDLKDEYAEAKKDFSGNLLDEISGARGTDFIDVMLKDIVSIGPAINEQIKSVKAQIQVGIDARVSPQDLAPLYAELNKLTRDAAVIEFDSGHFVSSMSDIRTTTEEANLALEAMAPALTEIRRKADAIEISLGSEDAAEVVKLRKTILQAEIEIATKRKEIESLDIDSIERFKKIIALREYEARLNKANADIQDKVNSTSNRAYREAVANTKDLEEAELRILGIRLETNDILKEDTLNIDQRNAKDVAYLNEMIKKRAIANSLLDTFDEKVKDALSTAEKMDGAWDNINKTIRSLERSITNYGNKIDDILRKQEISAASDEFNLGIDKGLSKTLDDITKKYDDLIAKAKEAGNEGTSSVAKIGSFTTFKRTGGAEGLEEEKKLALENAKASAEAVKLAQQRKEAEAEVVRKLQEQKEEQEDLISLIQALKTAQDTGEFQGVDGITKLNDAMLALSDAYDKVASSSSGTRKALGTLANIKGSVDVTRKYAETLKDLDKGGIKLKRSQAELSKSLSDTTRATEEAERTKLSKVYDNLTSRINEMVKGDKQLVELTDALTISYNEAASEADLFTGALAEQVRQFNDLNKAGTSFNDLLNDSVAELSNLGKAYAGADVNLDTEVSVDTKVTTTSEEFKRQLNAVSDEAGPIGYKTVIKEIILPDGTKDIEVSLVPDSEILQNSTEVIIKGETYTIVAKSQPVIDSITKALSGTVFDMDVKLNTISDDSGKSLSVQSNREGGLISGPGTGKSDSILSWLSNKEYVIQASAVAKFGSGFFDILNSGSLPRFASGGLATASASSAAAETTRDVIDLNMNFGNNSFNVSGERDQIKGLVDAMKYIQRGSR